MVFFGMVGVNQRGTSDLGIKCQSVFAEAERFNDSSNCPVRFEHSVRRAQALR